MILTRKTLVIAALSFFISAGVAQAAFIRTAGEFGGPLVSPAGFLFGYGYDSTYNYLNNVNGTAVLGYGYGYGYGYQYGFTYAAGLNGRLNSSPTATNVAATSFTVNYNTRYSAMARVAYGISSPDENTSQSGFQTGSQSIEVTGLLCGTTYTYRVVLTDAGGNEWTRNNDETVTTAACPVVEVRRSRSGVGSGRRAAQAPVSVTAPVSAPGATSDLSDAQIAQIARQLLGLPTGSLTTDRPLDTQLVTSGQAVSSSFSWNLSLGSSGTDVRALQIFLNSRGFRVAETGAGSPGFETDFFGTRTVEALAAFQTSVGISPALGFFGPVTRAYIQALP